MVTGIFPASVAPGRTTARAIGAGVLGCAEATPDGAALAVGVLAAGVLAAGVLGVFGAAGPVDDAAAAALAGCAVEVSAMAWEMPVMAASTAAALRSTTIRFDVGPRCGWRGGWDAE